MWGLKMTRRTLKFIEYYPTAKEIYRLIMDGEGWLYKGSKQFYLRRDRALVSLLYLVALRVSEVLRLRRNQFLFPDETGKEDFILIRGIKLSKSRLKDVPRKEQFRPESFLPLSGVRASLTELIVDYLEKLRGDRLLFNFGRVRAWQIVTSLTGETCHWFRAFGEEFLYEHWDHDLLAVADYVKVDPRTLQQYIRRRWKKYKIA